MPSQDNALLVLAAAFSIWTTAANASKPAVYTNWPACKATTEYVAIIPKAGRVEGMIYHERKKRNNVKTYLCQTCTQCLPGIAVSAPCSVREDTQCSSECAVAGCVADELFGCRLPGDPNYFKSISDMMDPCDPTTSKVTTIEGSMDSSHSSNHKLSLNSSRSLKKEGDGTSTSERIATSEASFSVQTVVFSLLFVLMFVLVTAGFISVCIMIRKKNVQSGTQRGDAITMTELPDTGHATSDV